MAEAAVAHRPRVPAIDKWLLVVVLLALVLRVGYAVLADRVDPFLRADPLHGDAAAYDRIARNLMAGEGFAEFPARPTAFWPPLYPAFLASVYAIFGHHLLAVRLIQAGLGTVAVAFTALAAGELFGERVALIAGCGMALYPHLIYFGAWVIAEAQYLALLTLALWMAVRLPRGFSLARLLVTGALLGLGVLAKPAALMLVPLFALWLWGVPTAQPVSVRLAHVLLFTVSVLAMIAPWTTRNYSVFGEWVPVSTNGGYTFYGANNPDAFGGHREGFPPALPGLSEPQAEREYYRLAWHWIAADPAAFARLAVSKAARLLSPLSVASYEQDYPLPLSGLVKALYAGFLALAFMGALACLRVSRQAFPFYSLILSVLIGTVLFYGDARYTLPMVPALVTFASVAVVSAADRLGPGRIPAATGGL